MFYKIGQQVAASFPGYFFAIFVSVKNHKNANNWTATEAGKN